MKVYKLPNAAASKITVTATATLLESLIDTAAAETSALPGSLNSVMIVPEDGNIRVLFDGNVPTAANGLLLSMGVPYQFDGVPLSKMRLIRTSANVVCSVQVGESDIDTI